MLHYFRCLDCLSSMTAQCDTNDALNEIRDAECACGGRLEYLGAVHDNSHAVLEYDLPKCDGRCISAPGNDCTCRCGGANHGTGLLVHITRDNGKAIVVPVDARAIERAHEFRAAQAAVEEKLGELYKPELAALAQKIWISREAWSMIFYTRKAARQHKTRIQKLKCILESIH